MVEKRKFTIRKKTLNNKSRKGVYYYLKEEGGPSKYFKFRKGISIDEYIKAYYGGGLKNRRRSIPKDKGISTADLYLKKISKRKNLDSMISKGITETEIPNFRAMDRRRIRNSYIKMLSPLVKDKELLKIIANEDNIKKLKHRIHVAIDIKSSDGRINIPLKAYNKTLEEVETDLQVLDNLGEIRERDLTNLVAKGYMPNGLPTGIDITGSKYHVVANSLGRVEMKLKFIKGK